jgi:serine-type D-Ala-D-Ala carboxypeptidase (penicillin-binding protein 5/6)
MVRLRHVAFLAAASLLVVLVTPGVVQARTIARGAASIRATTPPVPKVAATSGILIDRITGHVLWSKHPDLRLPMASTTKIMTLLIVLEHRRDVLDESFKVGDAVADTSGVGLKPGDRVTYRSAITGMIVRSATDCAVALAVDVAGDEASFVKLMNEHARAWKLTRTRFTNSSGAPGDPAHFSSARDLARLGRRAMRDPLVREFVTIKEQLITWETGSFLCHSRNSVLDYSWGEGVKPGYTPLARYCLVAAGTPGLRPLVSVTLHEPTRSRNMSDNVALLRYGSSFYHRVAVVRRGDEVTRRTLSDGTRLVCLAGDSLTGIVVRRQASMKKTVSLTPGLATAPQPGTLVGTATYRADGETLGTVDVYAQRLP